MFEDECRFGTGDHRVAVLAPQAGANALIRAAGGRGVLVGGVPGVRPADVVVLDLDVAKLRRLDERYAGRVRTAVSNAHELERACLAADLVRRMEPGSVLVDVAGLSVYEGRFTNLQVAHDLGPPYAEAGVPVAA